MSTGTGKGVPVSVLADFYDPIDKALRNWYELSLDSVLSRRLDWSLRAIPK